ncbi:3-hydroxybenzoate 6-monooxygenase [Leifsonia lichenia]
MSAEAVPLEARAIVVGCGIGGITAALALARHGIRVDVFERAAEIREVGAGLQVGPNAVRLLETLSVTQYLTEAVVLPERAVMRDIGSGEEIFEIPFGAEFLRRYDAPYQVLHRGDLLAALLAAAQRTGLVNISTGKEVVDVIHGNDHVTARFADGTAAAAEILIGADGIRSRVRRTLRDDGPPLASTYAIYRGTFARNSDIENAVTLQAGAGHHVMYYPIRGGSMVNLVCSFKSERGEPGSDEWGTLDELDTTFAQANPLVRRIITHLDRSKKWTQFDRPPRSGWVGGRVVLIGDAAHPTHQYFAQGACQAMEDGVELADLVGGSGDLALRLPEFEELRFARTSAVQSGSRFWGEWSHAGGLDAELRDATLRAVGGRIYEHLDWLYGADRSAPIPSIPPSRDRYEVIDAERAVYARGLARS